MAAHNGINITYTPKYKRRARHIISHWYDSKWNVSENKRWQINIKSKKCVVPFLYYIDKSLEKIDSRARTICIKYYATRMSYFESTLSWEDKDITQWFIGIGLVFEQYEWMTLK